MQRSHNPEWIISEPEKNEQNEALFFLQTYKENINNFVDDLEKNTTFFKCNQNEENFFERNIIESNRISDLLHRKGINIKSLSALFTKFSQPYLNNMTLNEMVIRICKKIVRFEFSKIISGISQNFDSSYLKQILFENLAAILNFLYDKKNKESQSFWNDCIWIQLESYFQIKISLEKKINYKFKLHSLIQLFESLGIEDKNKSFSLFKNLKKFTYLDFKETTIKSKIKSIDFIKFDCLKLFKSPITEENEPYQKRLFEIFGLANEFCLKKQLNYIKNGDYDIIINNISEELSYGIALNLKYSQLLFNIFLEKKDLQNALKTLDRVTEYDSFYFENLHPNYILSLMKLANFFMQEEFEEETVFLAKKIRRKFEKSIGEEACFYLNIYLKLLAIFDKFNCINEKIFCLEKICLFERENLEFFKDLICNYIKKGNKLQTRNTFRKFIGKINEKKMIILSKENINILLDLSSKFQNIKEENCSNECLKTIWICLQEIKIQKDYLPFILSEYFFKILQITIEGFSLETKEILKEFLGTLKEKKEKIKTCVDMILNISKKMTYSEFGEYFKNTLSKILLMQALDEKNKDEITMKAIFILVNLNFSNIQFF